MATFSDNFNRTDRDLDGDNGWIGHDSSGVEATGNFAIVSNQAIEQKTGDVGGFLDRNIGKQNFPITLTYDHLHTGTGARFYGHCYIGHSSLANVLTDSIRFEIFRTDSTTNNSQIDVLDGVTSVATQVLSFQLVSGTVVNVDILISADGSGHLNITQGANNASLTWGARTWTNGKGNYFAFSGKLGADGTGGTNTEGVDNIVYNYVSVSNPAFLLHML